MGDIQTERAYPKQLTMFQNKKRVLLGETGKEKLPHYYKNIGLGFKRPKEPPEGTYIGKKCPFTGTVSIRGRILSGVVTKMKMQRAVVIRRDDLHYIPKDNRFEKRHKNMSVHLSPCFRDIQIGDIGPVGECQVKALAPPRNRTRSQAPSPSLPWTSLVHQLTLCHG
ncbi:40S ribosomal protein S11-like [Echinops telfairi]|uniref:40S ribosomal protein S11-like n=1 Tax=Echinops telfairi TaxID=9371 RepID=A0ABM0ITR4_ECHTE|nr:40S ribosomal protein S11-like [Echinops telfairi]